MRPASPRCAERSFGRHAHFPQIAIAERSTGFEIGRERGTFRQDVDQARRRVLSVERALRSAQKLDALDALKIEQRDIGARERNAVERYSRRRFKPDIGARRRNAAHGDELTKGFADRVDRVQLRRERYELLDGVHSRASKTIVREHRDACRNIQRVHCPLGGGDDDEFACFGRHGFGRSRGRSRGSLQCKHNRVGR